MNLSFRIYASVLDACGPGGLRHAGQAAARDFAG
ncbi:Uncharacterised protein [Klebsiella pneumoniae]|uniref:Uncharacterized protein n=1 Tax=Klebsiella pneumoniae TaxID=573 RepID=A0A378A1M1_KLEPN|nr:Uncharacterised protein [Klebsiella pneumoniae]